MSLMLASVFLLGACRETFDVLPEDSVDETRAYKDVNDADAAIIGIYGQFAGLAKQYVLLNELRADLMSVTENADPYLQQINNHEVSADNAYTSPKPFYQVILNCNDALHHFDIMRRENRFNQTEYAQRYSDIGALRSWLYLQLGIHFGSVPYVTAPISTNEDIASLDELPKLEFAVLLDSLINFTAQLPYLDNYPASNSLLVTVDGYSTEKIFINRRLLLGDLYLWNNQYQQAAVQYRAVLETGGSNNTDLYKVVFAEVVNNNDISVGYLRYREQDINSLINSTSQGWKSIFSRSRDELWNSEWVWAIPFSGSFAPVYPFFDLFARDGGSYQVKPSQLVIDQWNAQVQHNGFPFDARGIFSYEDEEGVPVIKKYTYNYDPLNPLQRSGNWFLARAALLHLRFAEAANRDGHGRLAYALLNNGIGNEYDDATLSDKTNVQQTFLPAPYDFDARNSGTTGAPYYRATWYKNTGIRNRAYLKHYDTALKTNTEGLEDMLIQEAGLELAFEGNRWADLLRVALRRNDPAFLANKIADKLAKDGNASAESVRSKLLDRANWYLPFEL